jgi:hypothetical protein
MANPVPDCKIQAYNTYLDYAKATIDTTGADKRVFNRETTLPILTKLGEQLAKWDNTNGLHSSLISAAKNLHEAYDTNRTDTIKLYENELGVLMNTYAEKDKYPLSAKMNTIVHNKFRQDYKPCPLCIMKDCPTQKKV